MTKKELKRLIDVSAGRVPADLVLKGGQVVNVYTGTITASDVAICGRYIAGVGKYEGVKTIDVSGKFIAPGLIDSHIHVESAHLTPSEFSALVVPHGTTTVISDPHEIMNVCGMEGFRFMKEDAKNAPLKNHFMMSSCVPATPLDDSGATIYAEDMIPDLVEDDVPGLGEMMDFHGVVQGDDVVLDKILLARSNGKVVDGHACGLMDNQLNAYVASGILTDHESNTIDEMEARIADGMYVIMRMGTACHDLKNLVKGVNDFNYRRCLICSDDREPDTVFNHGHLEEHLRIMVENDISPARAICIASLNAAECYGLTDRGAIAPGKFADIVVMDDLKDFNVRSVYIEGQLVAKDGKYLCEVKHADTANVLSSVHVKDYSIERLKYKLDDNRALCIGMVKGGVLSEKVYVDVKRDGEGYFVFDPKVDAVKCAVIERHKMTGKIGLGLLSGYGLKKGAIALTIAHDSHNIICAGASDEEMDVAIRAIIDLGGGIVLAENGKVIDSLPLPIAGLMSDKDATFVAESLNRIQETAYERLGVNRDYSPVMTLCFMSLLVIPELKLTPGGLFDVFANKFI